MNAHNIRLEKQKMINGILFLTFPPDWKGKEAERAKREQRNELSKQSFQDLSDLYFGLHLESDPVSISY